MFVLASLSAGGIYIEATRICLVGNVRRAAVIYGLAIGICLASTLMLIQSMLLKAHLPVCCTDGVILVHSRCAMGIVRRVLSFIIAVGSWIARTLYSLSSWSLRRLC